MPRKIAEYLPDCTASTNIRYLHRSRCNWRQAQDCDDSIWLVGASHRRRWMQPEYGRQLPRARMTSSPARHLTPPCSSPQPTPGPPYSWLVNIYRYASLRLLTTSAHLSHPSLRVCRQEIRFYGLARPSTGLSFFPHHSLQLSPR